MKKIGIEPLIAMFIIAMGDWNGVQWEYFPKLPNCFTENLPFSYGVNCDFLRLTVNDQFGVECWFITNDGKDDTFYYGLERVKKDYRLLFTSIVTHVFDMIENYNEK